MLGWYELDAADLWQDSLLWPCEHGDESSVLLKTGIVWAIWEIDSLLKEFNEIKSSGFSIVQLEAQW
jgi:hypothetical protein